MTTAKGVGKKAVSGITWTLTGSLTSNVLRIAVIAVLGRLLTAEDFGVVAAAMTVILLARRLKEVGIGLALVQRKEITREHVQAVHGFQLAIGVASAAIVFAVAGPLADAYRMPAAADAIRVLSVLFVLRGLSSTSQFLCQREMQFRAIAVIDVLAYAIGSAVAIVLALAGAGPWALVFGYLVETALDTGLTMMVRPPPAPRIRWHALRDLLGFGGGQTAAGIANYFATQGDYIVVGRYLDAALLGVYTRAYELMRFPSSVFNTVAGGVLFSSFAKLQDDPARLGLAFRRVLFATAVLLMPASAGLFVLAPEAIAILLGPGWDSAVLPFQIMALSMVWRTGHKSASLVARSAGDVWTLALWQSIYAVLVIAGALVAVRYGIVGVAITTTAAVVIQFVMLTRVALRQVSIGWGAVIGAHLDGAVLAVLAVAGALPVAWALRGADAGVALVAIAATVAGLVLPVAYAVMQVRRGADDWTWLVERIRQAAGKKRKKQGAALAPDE